MEKVLGLGGVFFRAADPGALGKWYEYHLGISPVPQDYDTPPWQTEAGITVFAPFPKDTDYFGKADQQFMFNFRVGNLDAMVAQLRDAGIEVEEAPEAFPNGKFAWLHDPEGNRIELWEPAV